MKCFPLITICILAAGPVEVPSLHAQRGASPVATLTSIPFELNHQRVVLPVKVGESGPLEVLLDTGMTFDGIFLFHRVAAEALGGVEFKEVLVPGAGSGEGSRSIMADSISLRCGDALFPNQLAVISQSETTQGFPSDGVIGNTILGHHVVELDYDDRIMRLYDPGSYEAPASYERIAVTLQQGIPFLNGSVSVDGSDETAIRVYIDLASGDALELLVREQARFTVPEGLAEVYLGTGLSGDIRGGVGRVAWLRIGSFELHDVATTFPPAAVRSKQENADGVLGNALLRRFNLIFDYSRNCIWLKPNQSFRDPFQ